MQIEIPDDEAAAQREWQAKRGLTVAEARCLHDKAVADGRLHHAADWSFCIGLLEWSPPREFKVGDVVRSADEGTTEHTVKGVDGNYIIFGIGWDWEPAASYGLVKAVDDAQ